MRIPRPVDLPETKPARAPHAGASARAAVAGALALHAAVAMILADVLVSSGIPGIPEIDSPPMTARLVADDGPSTLPEMPDNPPPGRPVAPDIEATYRPAFPPVARVDLGAAAARDSPSVWLDPRHFGAIDLTPAAPPAAPRGHAKPRPDSESARPPHRRPAPPEAPPVSAAITAVPRFAPQPAYPATAVRQERGGTAHVRLTVSELGRVTASTIARTSGHPDLDSAALRATARWKFHPARAASGIPVESRVVVPVVFALR